MITIRFTSAGNSWPDEDPAEITLPEHSLSADFDAIADGIEGVLHSEGAQTQRVSITQTTTTNPVPGGTHVVVETTTITTPWRTSV